jgi:hypothetical protein
MTVLLLGEIPPIPRLVFQTGMNEKKSMNLKKTGDGGGQRVQRRSKSFCWLGCTRVWSTVVTPSASDSFFSKESWIGN